MKAIAHTPEALVKALSEAGSLEGLKAWCSPPAEEIAKTKLRASAVSALCDVFGMNRAKWPRHARRTFRCLMRAQDESDSKYIWALVSPVNNKAQK